MCCNSLCRSPTFLLPALEVKSSGLHLTIKIQDKYVDIKCFPLPVSSKVDMQHCQALDRLLEGCRSKFLCLLLLIVSRTLLDMKGLKFPFMLSPMKPLGKCVWNQLWSCPRSFAKKSRMPTGEFTGNSPGALPLSKAVFADVFNCCCTKSSKALTKL